MISLLSLLQLLSGNKMYLRMAMLRFPNQAKADAFILMMKGVFYEKLKTETLQQEQITIKTGEGKLIGIGFYKSEEDFKKSSNSVKKMFSDSMKSLDGVFEWQDGTIVAHWKRSE